MNTSPGVTVAVCTRNRHFDLARTLSSLIRQGGDFSELLVIDQSTNAKTAHVVSRYRSLDGRLRHVASDSVGLSRSRNIALHESRSAVTAFTDDDCLVQPGWIEQLGEVFTSDPTAGIAFGEVRPAFGPGHGGFIVGYKPTRPRRLTGRLGKLRDGGIGASMVVRTEAARAIGGFDEWLGAGGHFPSCEDGDFAYRMLANGWSLHHVPEAIVLHYGLRDWDAGSRLTRQTYLAVGAAYFKYVRCGDLVGALLLGQQLSMAGANVAANAVRLRRPLGLGRLASLVLGMRKSFEKRVDRRTLLYR